MTPAYSRHWRIHGALQMHRIRRILVAAMCLAAAALSWPSDSGLVVDPDTFAQGLPPAPADAAALAPEAMPAFLADPWRNQGLALF